MVYLILAVLSSALVAVLMRLGEKHITNNYAMFTANYFVCSLTAFLFIGDKSGVFTMREGLPFALILGLISGCLYLGSFTLMKLNIERNGVMLATVFMKLGVLIPVLMAMIVFREAPTVLRMTGFAVAVAAIIILNVGKSEEKRGKTFPLLLLLLLVSGFTESMANIFDKAGEESLKDSFLFFNFLTAMLLAGTVTAVKHKPVTWKDIAFGVVIGVPNYFASRFLLLSLGKLPAVAVYPVYNVGAIVLVGIAGIFLFKEKMSAKKYLGFGMIAAALVLLNL